MQKLARFYHHTTHNTGPSGGTYGYIIPHNVIEFGCLILVRLVFKRALWTGIKRNIQYVFIFFSLNHI